jgi:hypothetical protein
MKRNMKRWTDTEIKQLMQIMHKFGVKRGETKASKKFGRSAHACYTKYMELKKKMNEPNARMEFIDSKIDEVEKQFQAASKATPIETVKESRFSPKIALLRNAKVLAQTNDILVLQEDNRVIVYNI